MFCDTCQNIFRGEKKLAPDLSEDAPDLTEDATDNDEDLNYVHHELRALQASSEAGCQLCWLVWNGLDTSWRTKHTNEIDSHLSGSVSIHAATEGGQYDLRFNYDYDYDEEGEADEEGEWEDVDEVEENEEYGECEEEGSEGGGGGDENPYDIDNEYEDFNNGLVSITMFTAKELDQLTVGHATSTSTASDQTLGIAGEWLSQCRKTHSLCKESVSPSTQPPTRLLEIKESAKVYLRSSHMPDTMYTTLSHCWGKASITRLTTASLKSFQDGISISDLPPTFQHAIYVTERLGVRYIWIDSLCIIQDSEEDWLRESANMWAIYGNSCFNIAATASLDSYGGLFYDRSLLSVSPCKVHATWSGLQEGDYYCVEDGQYNREVDNSPLNVRGWVLQERALSSRILHFGACQLHWECRESLASEALPHGLPEAMRRERPHIAKHPAVSQEPGSSTSQQDIYKAWTEYVGSYSMCSLTRESDKLVALSGLARLVHARLGEGETYLAGLFKGRLVEQLAWEYLVTFSIAGVRPRSYRAPSWSWASIDGAVSMLSVEGDRRELAKVLHVHTTPVADPYGKVSDGLIHLQGRLFACTLEAEYLVPSFWINGDLVEKGYVIIDEKNQGNNLHCMPLVSWDNEGAEWIMGLILEPTNKEKGQFQRFGAFNVYGPESCEMLMRNDPDVSQGLEYMDSDGSSLYTISIV